MPASYAGALGESLCTPHGLNSIAADLFTGRTSEVSALRELLSEFAKVPANRAFTYDKGAKALRCLLPNGNHLYMPCFLAPAKGKTSFTGEEACTNKAIARCRYVIEITYSRVKDWKILAGEIPRENFHLLNSAWWWALGHSNMCLGMLVPPPGVPGGVSPLQHYSEWLDDQDRAKAAATSDPD